MVGKGVWGRTEMRMVCLWHLRKRVRCEGVGRVERSRSASCVGESCFLG